VEGRIAEWTWCGRDGDGRMVVEREMIRGDFVERSWWVEVNLPPSGLFPAEISR